ALIQNRVRRYPLRASSASSGVISGSGSTTSGGGGSTCSPSSAATSTIGELSAADFLARCLPIAGNVREIKRFHRVPRSLRHSGARLLQARTRNPELLCAITSRFRGSPAKRAGAPE